MSYLNYLKFIRNQHKNSDPICCSGVFRYLSSLLFFEFAHDYPEFGLIQMGFGNLGRAIALRRFIMIPLCDDWTLYFFLPRHRPIRTIHRRSHCHRHFLNRYVQDTHILDFAFL
jgi:hypothetical protein